MNAVDNKRLRPTLRRRLLLFLLVPLGSLTIIGIPFDYHLAAVPTEEAYDYALTDNAFDLAQHLHVRGQSLTVEVPSGAEAVMRADSVDKEFLAVYGPDQRLLFGDGDLLPHMPTNANDRLRVSDAVLRGQKIRKVTYLVDTALGPARVVVAETTRKRERAVSKVIVGMILPNVCFMIATLLLVYFGVRKGLKPLDELGQEIAGRQESDMSPLSIGHIPGEAEPLINAMNDLLADLRTASAAQQAFIANAAHQLKTPLAGLQTQLELAVEELPAQHRKRVTLLRDGTRRLGHLVHQLLALARSSPEANLGFEQRTIDLAELLRLIGPAWFDLALKHDIDLGFEAEPASVMGSAWLLKELLGNLIENAIQHTPAGGTITVRSGTGEDCRPFLEVEDSGPGIPEAERERIFERFYRGAGGTVTGTGLGLAIVKEVAKRHDACIQLTEASPEGGTRVTVRFIPA